MREDQGKSVLCFIGLSHSILDGGHRDIASLWFPGFLSLRQPEEYQYILRGLYVQNNKNNLMH